MSVDPVPVVGQLIPQWLPEQQLIAVVAAVAGLIVDVAAVAASYVSHSHCVGSPDWSPEPGWTV